MPNNNYTQPGSQPACLSPFLTTIIVLLLCPHASHPSFTHHPQLLNLIRRVSLTVAFQTSLSPSGANSFPSPAQVYIPPPLSSLIFVIYFLAIINQDDNSQSSRIRLADSTSHTIVCHVSKQKISQLPLSHPEFETHQVFEISATTALNPQCAHHALASTSLSGTPNASTTSTRSLS